VLAPSTSDGLSVNKRAAASDVIHLARLAELDEVARQFLRDAEAMFANRVEIDLRFAERDARCAASRASVMTFAACSNAFDGMQPTCKQVPPGCECARCPTSR